VLTIAPGDRVVYRTLDARWGLEPPHLDGTPRRRFAPCDPARDAGHALCGPLAIQGAEPGMALVVHINELRPGPYGWTWPGGHPHPAGERLGLIRETTLLWTLDPDRTRGRDQYGHEVALRPFMRVLGLPPAEPGLHSTTPPRTCGGNLDCRELVAGATLYLPITVPGALFSVCAGHAAQGDGQVSRTALECPMERVALIFDLDRTRRLTRPRAHTPSAG
jgi:acetamidase/formamidase